MALARWFGQPAQSNGSANACAQSSGHAKAVAINKAEHKQFGLENFGNTCYINSVLQALYSCHPFRELIIQANDKSNPTGPPSACSPSSPLPSAVSTLQRAKTQRKLSSGEPPRASDGTTYSTGNPPITGPPIPASPPTMFSALRALFAHISGNAMNKGIVAPKAFWEKLKKENVLFNGTMHQDAHELLIFLLNKIAEDLEEEARNVRSGSSSGEDLSSSITSVGTPTLATATTRSNCSTRSNIVHELFEGILTSETRCLTCETVSSRDEAFLDLSIDIEQNASVTACLRQFSASEMLCHKNKFFCDSCCGLQEAEKRMKIKRLPNVLALHLKRFKYQEDAGRYIKLAYRVVFPLELRLFNTADDAVDPDRLYGLFAIVVHIGNGPHHGHYIAIVKSGASWLVFDDDNVDTIKESDISKYFGDSNSGAAYVLFYQALDLDFPVFGLKSDEPAATESAARASPAQTPLLPPGLTHEGDSDASEFAPTTPASPALHSAPTVVPASPPALNVVIPNSEAAPAPLPPDVSTPTVSSPVASPSAKSSGFLSLRHSSSKPSFGSGSRRNTLDTDGPPVPPLPASVTSPPQLTTEPSEASTSTTSPTPNGKSKTTMEKASGWITRKFSARAEDKKTSGRQRRPATSSGPQASREHHDRVSFTSSSSSSRVPLVPDLPQAALPLSPRSEKSLPSRPVPPPSNSPSQDTPRSESTVPSNMPNGSAIPSSPLSTSNTLNNLSSQHHRQHHDHHRNFQLTGHKKSQPVLSMTPPSPESRKPPTVRPPKRPSTAGASPTHGSFARIDESPPDVPPLPDELRSPIPRSRTVAVSGEELERRRLSTSPLSPTMPSSNSTPLKRASRKLSFTGGMFGFARKDKDKQQEKERPRSSYLRNSSVVPGVSVNGRI